VAGSCEYSDEPLGSGAMELVIYSYKRNVPCKMRLSSSEKRRKKEINRSKCMDAAEN
jgi:hypothetical protein